MIDTELLTSFKQTPGAVSVTEAIGLTQVIADYPPIQGGVFVDLGSNAGKSSMIAAAAFSNIGSNGTFYLVDPLYGDDVRWHQWAYAANKQVFLTSMYKRLTTFSSLQFTLAPMESTTFLTKFAERNFRIDYCFVDSGDHGPELLNKEIDLLLPLLNDNALLIFHDYGNQFIAVSSAYAQLLEKGYRKVEIDWEPIKQFVKDDSLEKGNDSWHCLNVECPNFIGALVKGEN